MAMNCFYYVPDMDVRGKGFCIYEDFRARPHYPVAMARAIFHPQLNPLNEPIPVNEAECTGNGRKCPRYIPAIPLRTLSSSKPSGLRRAS